ncbi:hypothetical protein FB451DRAFT_1395023 [Mycena latifolia]|nr:hypothetical protein FB451DRAFT_1395023 [Mycena latifolia]
MSSRCCTRCRRRRRRHRSPPALRPARARTYPCSAATPAFARLVASTSTFQLTLDALLPVLDPRRPLSLVAFLLFALYVPHPIAINPFKSVLFVTFVKECEKALALAGSGVAPNKPLVWVLWKILKGNGDDLAVMFFFARRSARIRRAHSRTPCCRPTFRATKLILDESLYHTPPKSDLDDVTYPYDTAPVPAADALGERTITPEEDVRGAPPPRQVRAPVLSLAKQRVQKVMPVLPTLGGTALFAPRDLAPLAAPLFAALLATPSVTSSELSLSLDPLPPPPDLTALTALPPTLPTFDVP